MRTWLEKQFFRPRSALPFGIFRACLGVILLAYYIQIISVAYEIFAPEFLSQPVFILLQIITLAAAVLTTLGFHARLSTLLLFLCHSVFFVLNPNAFWGWGLMSVYFLALLLCTPCETLSIDRKGKPPLCAPNWNFLIFQILICLIYAMTVLHRVHSADWLDGSALTTALADGLVSRFPNFDWLKLNHWLRPFSYLGWGLEALGAFLLFLGPLQPWVALALVIFHLTLELTAMIGYWQFLLIAAMVFFLPDNWFQSEVPSSRFTYNPWIPAAIASLTLILTVDALPSEILPTSVVEARQIPSDPIKQSGMAGLRGMYMYKTARNIGRQCLFAAGENGNGEWKAIFTSEEQCRPDDVRFFNDEYYATLARYYIFGLDRQLGRKMCVRGKSRQIYFFSKQESFTKAGADWIRTPETIFAFNYDCRRDRRQDADPKTLENVRVKFANELSW